MWMSRKPLTPYFYPRPLRGGRRGVLSFDGTKSEFLSTPSARRATPVRRGAWSRRGYFYPRPLRGGRLGVHAVSMFSPIFLSTPSARRATGLPSGRCANHANFYPRPLRGGRLASARASKLAACISIHALCEEGDRICSIKSSCRNLFLSTPSARRATLRHYTAIQQYKISIHALCEEGDVTQAGSVTSVRIFLSTPSARRATAKTETKSLFSNKLYNILHEFRRALIYNGSKSYPNHAK